MNQPHYQSDLRAWEKLIWIASGLWWAYWLESPHFQVHPHVAFAHQFLGGQRSVLGVGCCVVSMPPTLGRNCCNQEPLASDHDLTGLVASSFASSCQWASRGSGLRTATRSGTGGCPLRWGGQCLPQHARGRPCVGKLCPRRWYWSCLWIGRRCGRSFVSSGPLTLGKWLFIGRIRVWVGWDEDLKCRLNLSRKAPICEIKHRHKRMNALDWTCQSMQYKKMPYRLGVPVCCGPKTLERENQ